MAQEANPFQSKKLDRIFGIDELKRESSTKDDETFRILEELGIKELYVEDEEAKKSAAVEPPQPAQCRGAEYDIVENFEPSAGTQMTQAGGRQQQVAIYTPEMINNELGNLITMSKKLMKTMEYILDTNPNAEGIESAAGLINSIRGVLKEFTNLYRDNIKYEKMKELEQHKAELKMKMLEHKASLSARGNDALKDMVMVEYSQEDLVKMIIKQETGPK